MLQHEISIGKEISQTKCEQNYTRPSLDMLAKDYLFKQHSKCINPLITCPPISFYNKHHCPVSKDSTDNYIKSFSHIYDTYNKTQRYKLKLDAYNNFYNNYRMCCKVYDKDNNSSDFKICKISNDGNVVVSTKDGLRVYKNNNNKFQLYSVTSNIHHINHSYNNRYMIASGFDSSSAHFSFMWQYGDSWENKNLSSYVLF
uniref:DDB1-and CUL4-associated factor 1 (Trinotate prediction) n=1 Tax=Henneguya salminicola TaxID=69463 RepID=A0A6G3MGI0_HENSL